MLKIAACLIIFALFIFLAILFRELSEETDNTLLFALFSTLAIVFGFFAFVLCLACICYLLAIGGFDNANN